MALIHFNMATFARDGDPGCQADNWNIKAPYASGLTSDPATFNPEKLNISNWAESMLALGAKHAVLTAKHGCGHLLWPTNTSLPDGREYTYCVGKNASAIKHDVLKEFSDTMQKHGIGHGFYYSLTNNFYLNVHSHQVQPASSLLPGQENVTQEQFEAIALSQVKELWSQYGALTEIWFDGGYTSDMKTKIKLLLNAEQPNAAAFGGYGVSPNPACWVGTESGAPGGEVWSTGTSHLGDPSSQIFCPKTCDTTLQEGDHWFFMGNSIRSLHELINVYHGTVGRNGMLELDFAINRDGVVEESHAARYKEFGDWIRTCYGTPVAQTAVNGTYVELEMPPGSPAVDRVMLQEDLAMGQRVRNYRVEYVVQGEWKLFSSGQSIGNKRIDLGSSISGSWTKYRLNITEVAGSGGARITKFAVYKSCSSGMHDEAHVVV